MIISKIQFLTQVFSSSDQTPYMKKRVQLEGTTMPRETVVQTYNAVDQLFLTDLLKFYMELCLKPYDLKRFIQFKPSKCMKPFVDDCQRSK